MIFSNSRHSYVHIISMGKLGRIRKYSHSRYQKFLNRKKHDGQSYDPKLPDFGWFASIPYNYQFFLRNVPSTILNEPSIENFTHIFTLLETNKTFSSQWNIIKHSQPFPMLCNFSTSSNIIAPAAKIILIINTDLTWNVLVGHRHVKGTIAIPNKLRNSGDFIYLFNLFDTCLVCSGICDSELVELATAANRQGCFKDHHGNIKAELCNSTIRPINCSVSRSIIIPLIQ